MTDVPVWPKVQFVEQDCDIERPATAIETQHNGKVIRNAAWGQGLRVQASLMDWTRRAVSQ